jgi:hypothetical protein
MRISKTVRTAANQDGAVLMDIRKGQMFSINPVGSRIWQQLNDACTPEEIAQELMTDFGISREQALYDVKEFAQQLEAQQLIRWSESQESQDALGAKKKGLFGRLFRWRNPHDRQTLFPEPKQW